MFKSDDGEDLAKKEESGSASFCRELYDFSCIV
jgi:hypothetical protein